jgi:hypothetical protein
MSKISDRSQGMVADPARPSSHAVPPPDNQAQFRQIQRDLKKPDVAAKRQRPESGRQNWRTG